MSSISGTASRARPCCAASRSPAPTTSRLAPARSPRSNPMTSARRLYFYADGGGIKIYARSYPTIERVEVYGNYASPCAGGVSVEHLDQMQDSVLFRDCIFRDNRTQITGSALDLLHGSRATLENCLFVGNVVQHGRRLRRPADRRRVPPGTRLGRHDGLRGIARHGQPVHLHRQLERRRRQRHRQHLRRDHLLEEHARRRHLARVALRARHHSTRPACVDRSSTATSTTSAAPSTAPRIPSIRPDPRFDAQFAPQAPQYAAVGYRPVRVAGGLAAPPAGGEPTHRSGSRTSMSVFTVNGGGTRLRLPRRPPHVHPIDGLSRAEPEVQRIQAVRQVPGVAVHAPWCTSTRRP